MKLKLFSFTKVLRFHKTKVARKECYYSKKSFQG